MVALKSRRVGFPKFYFLIHIIEAHQISVPKTESLVNTNPLRSTLITRMVEAFGSLVNQHAQTHSFPQFISDF